MNCKTALKLTKSFSALTSFVVAATDGTDVIWLNDDGGLESRFQCSCELCRRCDGVWRFPPWIWLRRREIRESFSALTSFVFVVTEDFPTVLPEDIDRFSALTSFVFVVTSA
jgi:hypothetical protein